MSTSQVPEISNDAPAPGPVPPTNGPAQQPNYLPPYQPAYGQMPPYYPPAPKKSKVPLIIAIVVIVIVVAAVFAAAILSEANNSSQTQIFKGAYIEYDVTGQSLFVTIDGSFRMEVTDVTTDGYTWTMTPSGIPGASPTSQWYPFDSDEGSSVGTSISEGSSYGTLIGQEHIHTAIGTKEVNHYREVNGTETIDYYITTTTGLPVRIQYDFGSSGSMLMELSGTNIDYFLNN